MRRLSQIVRTHVEKTTGVEQPKLTKQFNAPVTSPNTPLSNVGNRGDKKSK